MRIGKDNTCGEEYHRWSEWGRVMPDLKRRRGLPNGQFIGIPMAVAETRKFRRLSARAVRLLVDLLYQFNGYNNGDLCPSWRLMKERGWRSKAALEKALVELTESGLIECTRVGGRHQAALYAITWKPIDECRDPKTGRHKLDAAPTKYAAGTWHD